MSHYKTLGVEKSATPDDIKKAFRKLAKEYHPDTNPNNKDAENKFKEINAAYEVLSDPEKKKRYDIQGDDSRPPPNYRSTTGFGAFDELFREMGFDFGFSSASTRIKTRQDVRADLHLKIEDGFNGTKMKIEYKTLRGCTVCKKDQDEFRCSACHGTGMQTRRQHNFVQRASCSSCSGIGFKKKIMCRNCYGEFYREEKVVQTLDIPKGVRTGQIIKVTGGGQAGADGIGDLLVNVVITNTQTMRLVKDDLFHKIPISVIDLVLGKDVILTMPDKRKVYVTIPPGTQVNGTIKIAAQGYPIADIYGNLYIEFDPFVPALDETSRNSLKQALQ